MTNQHGGRRDNTKRRPDDKRGGRRTPGPGKKLGRPKKVPERSIPITDDMLTTIAYLEQARAMCFNETAQRGIDQIIAALTTARDE